MREIHILLLVLLVLVTDVFGVKLVRLYRMKRLAKIMGLNFAYSPFFQQLKPHLRGKYNGHELLIRDCKGLFHSEPFWGRNRTRIKVDEIEIADLLIPRTLSPSKIMRLIDNYITNGKIVDERGQWRLVKPW